MTGSCELLTKYKLWFGVGVIATAVGIVAERTNAQLWPARSSSASVDDGDSAEAGESGEAGEAINEVEEGERGTASGPVGGGEAGESAAMLPSQSGEGGERGRGPATAEGAHDFAGGSFDAALAEVLGGEGGKDGLGISPLVRSGDGWGFSVPALTAAQISKAVVGNSLRSERHFAVHFEPNGHYRGWSYSWSKGSLEQCSGNSGPTYGMFDGECWVATENTLSGGWKVARDTLCMMPAPRGVTAGQTCVRGALMLNSLVFFGPDGRMIGKGAELLPGDNAGRDRRS